MTGHDFWEPRLRVRASGLGGSGYRIPTWVENGKPVVVPGVTTVLGALDKPGVVQWAVDNTAAYAAANAQELLNRTEVQGFNMLRWYHRKTPDFDDPIQEMRDYSNGVLNDLADLGTMIHDWIAFEVADMFPPDLIREEQTQMAEAYLDWKDQHYIEPVVSEVSVLNTDARYAGTLDHVWNLGCDHEDPCLGQSDGELIPTMVDVKSSRAVRDSHIAQLAALGAANVMMREVGVDYPGAVEYDTKQWGKTYWVEDVPPDFSRYAILQVRPKDIDKSGERIPAFCSLHPVDQRFIDLGYETFLGALRVRHAERSIKDLQKELGKEY